jgi:hypothetical protein
VSVEVFDPSEKRVVTKATAPIVLAADAGAEASPAPASAETADTTLPAAAAAATQAPAKSAVDLSRGTVTLPLWALAAIPGAALVAGGAFALVHRRRLRETFEQALAPEAGETKERAAARIDRALREVLARRHGVSEGAPAAEVVAALRERGLSEARIGEIRGLLDDVDFLRLAPQLGDYEARIRETRARAARVLARVG